MSFFFDMPSKPPAMLKSQPANTCLEKKKKKSREHCHAILGGFHFRLYLGESSQACMLPPHCSPDANAANLTWRVMDLSVEHHE